MLLALAQWIQNTGLFVGLRGSAYWWSIVLACHISSISVFGGMIILTDLCLLGWVPRQVSAAAVIRGLRLAKRIGFVVTATFGVLLFSCKAEQYYYNFYFRTKLLLFGLVAIHALMFRRRVYNRPSGMPSTREMRLAGIASLLIWAGILIAGREIGYLPAPAGLHFL